MKFYKSGKDFSDNSTMTGKDKDRDGLSAANEEQDARASSRDRQQAIITAVKGVMKEATEKAQAEFEAIL